MKKQGESKDRASRPDRRASNPEVGAMNHEGLFPGLET